MTSPQSSSTPLSLVPPTACTTSPPQPDPAPALVAFADLWIAEMGPLRPGMCHLAPLLSPRLEGSYLQCGKSIQRTNANMNPDPVNLSEFCTTQFWHLSLSKVQEQGPKCPTIPVCLRPKLKTSQRLSLLCCSMFFSHNPSMTIHRAKARAVFTYQMAMLALPTEAPAKVLLFAFGCQPDLPMPYHRQLIFPLQPP